MKSLRWTFLIAVACLLLFSMKEIQARRPRYVFSKYQGVQVDMDEYHDAVNLIEQHADTDDFRNYMIKKRNKFTFTELPVSRVLILFYESFRQGGEIKVLVDKPYFPEHGIGGWNGRYIKQNGSISLHPYKRAGHLLHETAHVYGWMHRNDNKWSDENINSFPYAIGYGFEDYLYNKLGDSK